MALPTDVTDYAQAETMVRRAEESFGGVDVLVNAAGKHHTAHLRDDFVAFFKELPAERVARVQRPARLRRTGLAGRTPPDRGRCGRG
jgi:NAD(P)-dependent dehydrogenase (short-subunit alcohol dehydrogenase family)